MRRKPYTVGVYALLVQVAERTVIRIGRLGPVPFAPGVYVYIGSALNSLEGRISRHFRDTKRSHWHIDYLVGGAGVSLLHAAAHQTSCRVECSMSRSVQKRAISSISHFGCSDCNCDSHLHFLGNLQTASSVLFETGFSLFGLPRARPYGSS